MLIISIYNCHVFDAVRLQAAVWVRVLCTLYCSLPTGTQCSSQLRRGLRTKQELTSSGEMWYCRIDGCVLYVVLQQDGLSHTLWNKKVVFTIVAAFHDHQ